MNLSIWKNRPSAALSPFNGDLARFRDELDRTFDRIFIDPLALATVEPKSLRAAGWVPAIDVSETDKELTIRAEAPGIAAKDLSVSVSGNVLTIAGAKEERSEKTEENFYHCERRFGSFRRSIDLPDSADTDRISADAENGVVTIHVAKKPGAKPKQIQVKPAAAATKIAVTG